MAVFFDDDEGAIDALGIAVARGGRNVVTLAANDPNIERLRSDPRVKQMLSDACARHGIVVKAPVSPAAT